jgi:hypothetical protein
MTFKHVEEQIALLDYWVGTYSQDCEAKRNVKGFRDTMQALLDVARAAKRLRREMCGGDRASGDRYYYACESVDVVAIDITMLANL